MICCFLNLLLFIFLIYFLRKWVLSPLNIRTTKCKIFTSPKHSIGSGKANKSGEQEKKE